MTGALVGAFRAAGRRVAVLAVDPTSPFTGGALLGDRIRMQEHATDDQVFIRSMASRGHLGGLAAATPQAIRVLDAAGFDLIIIETVGVGQAEVAVASLADSVVVLLAPGMGDADAGGQGRHPRGRRPVRRQQGRQAGHPAGGAGPAQHDRARGPGPGRLEAADHHRRGHQRPAGRGHRRAGHPPGRALGLAALQRGAAAAAARPGPRGDHRAGLRRAAGPRDRQRRRRAGRPGRGRDAGPVPGRRADIAPPEQRDISACGFTVVPVGKPLELPFDPIDRAARIWEARFGPSLVDGRRHLDHACPADPARPARCAAAAATS